MKKLVLAVFLMFTALSYAGYESNIKAKISKLEKQRDAKLEKGWEFMTIGAYAELQGEINDIMDKEMTKVYNLIRAKMSETEKINFRNKQRQWLKKRKQYVENSAKEMSGGGAANVEAGAYEEITKKRLYEFARMYDKMKK